MVKLILVGFWSCCVAVMIFLGLDFMRDREKNLQAQAHAAATEYQKSQPISVPMIGGGRVRGYVVAQFIFVLDTKEKGALVIPLDPLISSESFQAIYQDKSSHLDAPEQYDLTRLTADIAARINARAHTRLVKNVLVEQFTYVSYEDIRNKGRSLSTPPGSPQK